MKNIRALGHKILVWVQDVGLLIIAIVALARYMIPDMKSLDTWRMLAVAGAALLIALSILVSALAMHDSPAIKRMTVEIR